MVGQVTGGEHHNATKARFAEMRVATKDHVRRLGKDAMTIPEPPRPGPINPPDPIRPPGPVDPPIPAPEPPPIDPNRPPVPLEPPPGPGPANPDPAQPFA